MFGYRRVLCGDFEFGEKPHGVPDARCGVFLEFYSGELITLRGDELATLRQAPFDTSPDTLFCAYNAEAEMSVFLELGWQAPRAILDLWPEFRAITNGRRRPSDKTRLVDMLAYYGIFSIDVEAKDLMHDLARRGPPYTPEEWDVLITGCRKDVEALRALLAEPRVQADLAKRHPREMLHTGRFMAAVARKTRHGMPCDGPGLTAVMKQQEGLALAVAEHFEARYHWGIYDQGSFRYAALERWLDRENIRDLPRTRKSKRPQLKTEVLMQYEVKNPKLTPLRQCMHLIDLISKFNIPVYGDGRTRYFANSFGSITGRDQPGTTRNLFSLPKLFRPYIMAGEGEGFAYIDVSSQEIWLAAMLSGDQQLWEAYLHDIYVQSLIAVGQLPPGATRETHPAERDKLGKPFVLGTNYGQRKYGLSARLNISEHSAETILRRYGRAFPRFHQWRQGIVNGALGRNKTYVTKLGWPYWTGGLRSARSMMNFPMQAAGGDWMRTALIALTEAGIGVCAAVHDGFLVSGPAKELDEIVRQAVLLCQATGKALWGTAPIVRCDQEVRWNDPFPRFNPGETPLQLWNFIQAAVQRLSRGEAA
jgi:hypothetical protein